MSAQPEARA